jgi:hypothetical protein
MMNKTKHMAQQTAVDWLFEQIPVEWTSTRYAFDAYQQAKQMELWQLIDLLHWMNKISTEEPMRLETDHDDIVQQYYNETFGK